MNVQNSVTSLLIDNVENNRGQKYPLQGVTRFNQVVIKLQQDAPYLGITRDAG